MGRQVAQTRSSLLLSGSSGGRGLADRGVGLFPASRSGISASRAAGVVCCRAWRWSRPTRVQQERQEPAAGFGQAECALQGLARGGGGTGQVAQVGAGQVLGDVRITARNRRPVPVGTGLRPTRAGNVLPSWRRPASRARAAIGRAVGCWAYPDRWLTCAARRPPGTSDSTGWPASSPGR